MTDKDIGRSFHNELICFVYNKKLLYLSAELFLEHSVGYSQKQKLSKHSFEVMSIVAFYL